MKKFIGINANELKRNFWLNKTLQSVSKGQRLLDVGAGELNNKQYCGHLIYVSQDLCQYEGSGDGVGLQTGAWDTTRIDIVSDITAIPAPEASFDIVLCTEVLEHVPDPLSALKEMSRLCKRGGQIIITAPFCSLTHFAPYHYSSGFSRYWYERHFSELGFSLIELSPNGNWLDFVTQELWRLPSIGSSYASQFLGWLSLLLALPAISIMRLMKIGDRGSSELLTFGWHVVAKKK